MTREITIKDYQDVAPAFFDKFNYVAKNLPEGTKVDDVVKIMQQIAVLVMKKRAEEKPTVGFNQ